MTVQVMTAQPQLLGLEASLSLLLSDRWVKSELEQLMQNRA